MKMFKFQLMLSDMCPRAFKLKGTMRVLQFHLCFTDVKTESSLFQRSRNLNQNRVS